MNWSEYRLFFREFRQRFHDTGAILPSGRALAKALASAAAPSRRPNDSSSTTSTSEAGGRRILEIGPGTGPVTDFLVRLLGPNDRLELVEINERFVEMLERRFEIEDAWKSARQQVRIRNQSIEDVAEPTGYDVVISSLPLNNFSAEFVRGVLEKYVELSATNGRVTFFEYIAVRPLRRIISGAAERQRLSEIGSAIASFRQRGPARRTAIWANVPPAWVHDVEISKDLRPET